MPNEANNSPHSAYAINYHLIWILRYRKNALVGPIAERLKNLFNDIAAQ